ncbi:MAG: RagB/SusD family nutrient uptake outer membrane protein [Flavobacteriaceae bacterium]|nr:RagB/SusD family nutrient uptake outer membrane protein [Flavobacteriaceae bacterium]MDG2314260.1 RagB/SusD family nutrient uptake outer membrane protein [Flavobacteriaceae bacterium]
MKLFNTYTLLIVVILFFSSCDEDYLNIENPNDLSAASFWSSEDDIQKGLIATYAALQLQGMLGGSSAIQHPVRSDIGRPNNWNANAISLNTLTYNENTEIVSLRWRDAYIGIYRANQVLSNLGNIEMSSAVSTQIEAEARFLRAFFYNSLYRGYNGGSVIIHTDVPEMRNDFYKKPSPASKVYALILKDLEYAYQNLPQSYDDSADLGRATWGAATAMLAKLHLNEKNYGGARDYFKEIINSNLYELTANIGDNFDEEHEFNSESIFEVAFSIDAKPGTSFGAQDGPTGSEATNRAIGLATTQGGGYRTVMPSYYMTMLFKNDIMDMTNPINASRTGTAQYSIRTSVSVAIADDDNTTMYQLPSNTGGAYNNSEASYLKKFQNWHLPLESDQSVSGINERVIRLADVMLLYAECLLQTAGDFTEALDMVNAIRTRAGVLPLTEADYDTDSLMEHIMWVERPLELMFEGHDIRWEDLTRWGKVKEQYERLAAKSYTIDGKVLYEYDSAVHGSLKKIKEFVEAAKVYSPEAHDYFPIPAAELNSNPDFLD